MMRRLRAPAVLLCGVVLIQLFAAQIDAQSSRSPWKTVNGNAPLVIARGGFSGLFPDSSIAASQLPVLTSVPGAVQWCDVQLTKDGLGICFPDLTMSNASIIEYSYPSRQNTYPVNGVPTQGWFTIDFSLRDLSRVFLIRGILSRSEKFDGNGYAISTVQNISTLIKPDGIWLNIQHDEFYVQHNFSMSSYLVSASRTISIDYISSPEVNFFKKIDGHFGRNGPNFVFQFLGKEDFEPTTNQTYGGQDELSCNRYSPTFFAAAISNPFRLEFNMFRNPIERNSGNFLSLSEFLNLAKNSTSLSGVLISVENVAYLRENQGLDVVKAVLDTLTETGYSNGTTKTKVMIQSTNSSVLVDFKKHSQYETVYKVEDTIRDILDFGVEYIKKFGDAVVIDKRSIYPSAEAFLTGETNVVHRLQKFQVPVYVELFQNEFVSQAYDFFSDPTVEINSYIRRAGINGTITEFPLTAARYKSKWGINVYTEKKFQLTCPFFKPGDLLTMVSPASLPPAQAPELIITDADVIEPPLPPVRAKSPTSTPRTSSTNAQAPSGQTRLTLSLLLSFWPLFLLMLSSHDLNTSLFIMFYAVVNIFLCDSVKS